MTEPPLDAARLTAAVVRPGGLWRSVEVVPVTGSTNADLLARAAAGEPEGAVLVAERVHPPAAPAGENPPEGSCFARRSLNQFQPGLQAAG